MRELSGVWLRLGVRRLAVPKDPKCGPPPFSPKVAILTEKKTPGGAAETVAKGLVYQQVAILTENKTPGGAADHSPRG